MTWVDGHYRSGSGWVEGHWRTEPDSYEWNNLGFDGIDRDYDGYGAGETNPLYDHYDLRSTPSLDHGSDYGVDSYDSYDTYDSYGSGWDSGWDTGSTWASDYGFGW